LAARRTEVRGTRKQSLVLPFSDGLFFDNCTV